MATKPRRTQSDLSGRRARSPKPLRVVEPGNPVGRQGLVAPTEDALWRLRFLADASDVLTSSLDDEVTLRTLARLAVPGLADWCAIHLVEPDGTLRSLTVEHVDAERAALARTLEEQYPPDRFPEQGIPRVIRNGKAEFYPVVTDEMLVRAGRDDQHLQRLREIGMRSSMMVPLIARGRTIGSITLVAGEESGRSYTDEDLSLAEELARRAAMAVDNARLFREIQEADAELRLRGALLESQSEASLDGILVVSSEGTILSHNSRFTEMWNLTEEVLSAGSDDVALEAVRSNVADPDEFLSRIAYLYEHMSEESREEIQLTDGRIFDRWSAPLKDDRGTYYGRAWYFRDVTEQKRIEQELFEGQKRAGFLAEAGVALTSSMDYRAMLARLAEVAVAWFADWCAIDILTPDLAIERVVIANKDVHAESIEGVDALRTYSRDRNIPDGVQRVIATGQWEMGDSIEDAWLEREARGDKQYLEILRRLNLRSFMCLPMKAAGRTLGAITLVTTAGGRRFGPADLAMAEEVAARAGSAVDNARLYQEHTYISKTLQKSLLPPHLPDIPGVEVEARYHAAGEGYEVGGDFFDLFETARGDWAIVVGDVCGKGADAAATTALARHTLRAAAMQARKPSRVLRMLNEAMLRAETRFCTAAYVRLRPSEGSARATTACGGHPLPLVVRADGRIETAGKPGTLLGSFPDPGLAEHTVDLHSGDVLVLYTDGVTEARNDHQIFGDERLSGVLETTKGKSAAEIAAAIESAALDFQHGRARDDIAVVVLRIR